MARQIRKYRLYFDIEYKVFCFLLEVEIHARTKDRYYLMVFIPSGIKVYISRNEVLGGRLIDTKLNPHHALMDHKKNAALKVLYAGT